MADPTNWKELPVLVEFHWQWWRARGKNPGASKVAFTRDWEELLTEAGLTRAELRAEAERDARFLAGAGLWEIRSVPRRPHLPARIRLPVAQELRLARLFNDPLDEPRERFDPSQIDWEPELAFLANEKSMPASEDLLAINRFLKEGGRHCLPVPIKERSVALFGDEKRLDALTATSLFRDGRLTLEALRAFSVPEPLGWRRGPAAANDKGAVLVLENAATWDSFSRWNALSGHYAAVVYGMGHRFLDGIPFLKELEGEIGRIQHIDYFGDLDPEGIRIPASAAGRCSSLDLPVPQPLVWAYRLLLENGRPVPLESLRETGDWTDWLGPDLAPQARELFQTRHRLAQEWVGHEVLARLDEMRPDRQASQLDHKK